MVELRKAVDRAGRLSITQEFRDHDEGAIHGAELLRDGMTFDIRGLAPSEPIAPPVMRFRYGVEPDLQPRQLAGVSIQPGPHLAAGAHSIPVVRTMAGIAASLTDVIPECVGVSWLPAQTLSGPTFFSASIAAWLEGGAFPALGLTAVADEADGGMRTVGLSWFTGQEVRLAAELAKDRGAGARLAIRLINQLILQGRLVEPDTVIGLDGGRLALEPTRDGSTVRVRRA